MASVVRGAATGDGFVRRTGLAMARAVRRTGRSARRSIRRHTHGGGAGESGLAKLIELHAVNSAGDMMITVALASTIFFSVPSGEARNRVALYLLVTMAPFAVLAPVVGPLLDRLPHGRRMAMAGSMLARAVLAWTMAGVVSTAGLALYPEALGCLVASKAYGVVRSAVVPRLLPSRTTLVKANSRVTLAGLLATAVAAPLGGLLHIAGPGWPLYGAFVIFVAGTMLSLALPQEVDSAKGEARASFSRTAAEAEEAASAERAAHAAHAAREARAARAAGDVAGVDGTDGAGEGSPRGADPRGGADLRKPEPRPLPRGSSRRPGLLAVGSSVRYALEANASLRALSGFLTLFLAFLLREQPLGGLSGAFSLGVVAVSAGGGNALGTAIGSWIRSSRGPERIIVTALVCALTAAAASAAWYSVLTVALVAGTAGLAQALAKLSLDAMIQRDVPELVRTSAFARSETTLQLAWVLGGGVGIVLPLNHTLGLSIAASFVALGFAASLRGLLTPHPRLTTPRAA
jgi:MFS family permease